MIFNGFLLLILTNLSTASQEGNKNSTVANPALISKIYQDLQFYSYIQTDECMSILIKRAIESFSKIYLIMSKSERHERLIKNLQTFSFNSIFTDPDEFIKTKSSFNFQLFLFYGNFTIENILHREPSRRTKFLVLVENYDEGVKKLEEFWKYKIVDVVFAFLINSTAYYYTYYPYSKDHCSGIGKPVLFAHCDLEVGKFIEKTDGFFPKANNLYGCEINIALSSITPMVFFSKGKLTGMEVELMDELMYEMNGKPKYILKEPEEIRYGVDTGYGRLLEKSEIAGGAAMSLKNVAETDFFTYGQSVCVTWAVPVQLRRKGWMRSLHNIFSISTWLLLTASFTLISIAFKIFNESRHAFILHLLSLLLDSPIRQNLTPKILFILWLWFTFIINAAYRGGYQSQLLLVDIPQQIHTTEEIFDSNLTISGFKELLEETMPVISQNQTIDKNRLKQVPLKNYIQDGDNRKNVAYLGIGEVLIYHTAKNNLRYYIYIQKTCIVNYHLVFLLKKNSHLTRTISRVAKKLTENGFTSYLHKKYFYQPTGQITQEEFIKYLKQHPLKLDFYKLGIVFIVFAIGMIISIIVFILELFKLF